MKTSIDQALRDPAARENGVRDAARVEAAIAETVTSFGRERYFDTFHLSELAEYVRTRCGTVAPDSAGRILRALRKRGVVDYHVVSRAESLYCITRVED
ncbi:MAG: hypothetical protein HY962_07010 [Ignavibacteriae bacterium]|nr:hypothetical protein [Ignavibacteriota bacterium]